MLNGLTGIDDAEVRLGNREGFCNCDSVCGGDGVGLLFGGEECVNEIPDLTRECEEGYGLIVGRHR